MRFEINSKNTIMKITVVGAGAVGASCAEYIAIKNFASEVVLLDIKEGYAEGKAMDLMQTASLNLHISHGRDPRAIF